MGDSFHVESHTNTFFVLVVPGSTAILRDDVSELMRRAPKKIPQCRGLMR